MELLEYQEKALRTESIVDQVNANKEELALVLKSFVIVTEMLDVLKKKIYYNNPKKYNSDFSNHVRELLFTVSDLNCVDSRNDKSSSKDEKIEGVDPRVFHGIIGIATEAGELVAALQKAIAGDGIDAVNIGEEIGDIQWYIAILCHALKQDPRLILNVNIRKLVERFKDKYNDASAELRNLDLEREILETLTTGIIDE